MIRFAIVGTGRISDWILKGALQDHRFEAVAICSRTKEKAEAFKAKHPEAFRGEAKTYASIDELTSAENIDAVYIGTPNSTHLEYTLKCLRAGKHVLCEKPLGCSEAEVTEMIAAARQSGKVLMEAMISTLNPNFLKARELIKEIGPVRHYSSSFCQYSSRYEDLRMGIVSNSFNPKMGGGALSDIGVYVTYPLALLFGDPMSLHADNITLPTKDGETIVHGAISAKYGEMTAALAYSKAVDSLCPTEIAGEKGNIFLDNIHICREVSFAPHAAPSSGRGEGARREVLASGLDKDEYYYEFKEFIDVIESGCKESAINSLQTSLINRKIMDKAI